MPRTAVDAVGDQAFAQRLHDGNAARGRRLEFQRDVVFFRQRRQPRAMMREQRLVGGDDMLAGQRATLRPARAPRRPRRRSVRRPHRHRVSRQRDRIVDPLNAEISAGARFLLGRAPTRRRYPACAPRARPVRRRAQQQPSARRRRPCRVRRWQCAADLHRRLEGRVSLAQLCRNISARRLPSSPCGMDS